MTAGVCVYDDDFTRELKPRLIDADMVVFCSPMYYFGFSSQLKAVIDRFYWINDTIKGVPKKTALLVSYGDDSLEDADAIKLHYETIAKYLGWKDCGIVAAQAVVAAGDVRGTRYGEEAYKLGRECE
jgi:multimeric flavodoxin WrbA